MATFTLALIRQSVEPLSADRGLAGALDRMVRSPRRARPTHRRWILATIALVVLGLFLGAISCAKALGVGVEHDEHIGSSINSIGFAADSLAQVGGVDHIATNSHHGHSTLRLSDGAEPTQDSDPSTPAESTGSFGVDMVCAAVTNLRVPDPIVSLVVRPIWYGFEAIPPGCVIKPEPPVPKSS